MQVGAKDTYSKNSWIVWHGRFWSRFLCFVFDPQILYILASKQNIVVKGRIWRVELIASATVLGAIGHNIFECNGRVLRIYLDKRTDISRVCKMKTIEESNAMAYLISLFEISDIFELSKQVNRLASWLSRAELTLYTATSSWKTVL